MSADSEKTSPAATALYQRLVGDDWRGLDAPVRRFHLTGASMSGAGSFTVRRGTRRASRMLAWLLRTPAVGEDIRARLVVTPHSGGERWHRTFDGQPFVTEQRAHPGRFLAESLGILELRFRLEVKDGALFYRQTRATFGLGSWRVPLPAWLAPRIAASEAAKGENRVRVSVRVYAPLVGLLLAYEGDIVMEEAEA
jgi:hypothetical protein